MNATTCELTLNEGERELILDILEERHRTLLVEISHTDHHHFKLVLRKKAELLESVLNRLLVREAETTGLSLVAGKSNC
jgi:hypothetical protein